ncbi:sensor histidine kinase [Paenibacillus arenilitoris]|uniref:histidine kinase n=1 Tax=Paenibacillus arenilitoris TaxID=2772299 RepID=A0A927CP90_9BACL|nr:sensor histidine kinase [Paenibacillus arenilitoris]MBD2869751.1 sensor histidine kinase [Paenibacillus arenilitoris]
MQPFFAAALCLLLAAVLLLVRDVRARKKQIVYIRAKLEEANAAEGTVPLYLNTSDRELQRLLVQINRLIDGNRKATAAYARNERSMRTMLTNMSHDLRTPLTVVLGLTETIAKDEAMSGEERSRLLHRVHAKALEMTGLMDKFFDLARLESDDKPIPLAVIPMHVFCQNLILFFYDAITAKGLEAAIDLPDEPLYALGNEEALERICGNLLTNAIRYGSGGGVIGFALRGGESGVVVEVWDRGQGIAEPNRQRVFERLYTLEDSRNPLYQGSGLGLAISKRLAQKLGGDLDLRSVPYEKTVFTLTLKQAAGPPNRQGQNAKKDRR